MTTKIIKSIQLAFEIFAFICWLIYPIIPNIPMIRFLVGLGIGSMFGNALLFHLQGESGIRHEVWCKGRKECGE